MGASSGSAHARLHQVLGALSREEDVFKCVQPLLVSVLDGRSVCVMAYGQTGRCAAAGGG
jgi:hypothetical protein